MLEVKGNEIHQKAILEKYRAAGYKVAHIPLSQIHLTDVDSDYEIPDIPLLKGNIQEKGLLVPLLLQKVRGLDNYFTVIDGVKRYKAIKEFAPEDQLVLCVYKTETN